MGDCARSFACGRRGDDDTSCRRLLDGGGGDGRRCGLRSRHLIFGRRAISSVAVARAIDASDASGRSGCGRGGGDVFARFGDLLSTRLVLFCLRVAFIVDADGGDGPRHALRLVDCGGGGAINVSSHSRLLVAVLQLRRKSRRADERLV